MKSKTTKYIRRSKESWTDFQIRTRDGLRHSKRAIVGAIETLFSEHPRLNIDSVQKVADAAVERIGTYAAQVVESLSLLREQKIKGQGNYRQFQAENGITRDARQPDKMITFFILQCGILAEGMLGAALFLADGHFDLITSFATGFAIAGINAMAACAVGYFGGRYIGYRIDAQTPLLRDTAIRLAAWLGMLTMFAGLAVLHFGAARVRVTGKHNDLFDFSSVSFADTFQDYFALGLITVGVVGAAIAFFKGRHGFSDPIVGYSQIAIDTDLQCKQAADTLYHDAMAHIETMQDAACEAIETRVEDARQGQQDYQDERLSLTDRINHHNDQVDHMIEVLREMHTKEQETDAFIRQSAAPSTPFDLSGFEALKLLPLAEDDAAENIADSINSDDLLAAIEQAAQDAIARIEEAHNAFLMPVTPYAAISSNPTNQEVSS